MSKKQLKTDPYFHGTPDEEAMFSTVHKSFDVLQRLMKWDKKQRDEWLMYCLQLLHNKPETRDMATALKFHSIVDFCLQWMKDYLDGKVTDTENSFTFKEWVV